MVNKDIYLERNGEKIAVVRSYVSNHSDNNMWFLKLTDVFPCDKHSAKELLTSGDDLRFVVIKNTGNITYDECFVQAYSDVARGNIGCLWVNAYARKEIPIEAIS